MPRFPANERAPLARLPLLLGIGVVLASAFVFLHFGPTTVEPSEQVDPITLTMLRLRLDFAPERNDLRLKLARVQFAAGDFEATLGTLRPLMKEKSPDGEVARSLGVEAMLDAWRALGLDQPRKKAARHRLVSYLETERSQSQSSPTLQRWVEIAREVQRPDLAAYFELDQARGANDPSLRCPEAQGNACHAMRAIDRALEAGSGVLTAHIAAEAVRLFPHHSNVVHRAVRKALEMDNALDAISWLEQLLPHDRGRRTLDLLVSLELAQQRPDRAMGHLLLRLEEDPSAVDLRPKTAQLAEWAGRPDVALEQWTLVGREMADVEALDKARRLARQLADVPLVCRLLFDKGRLTRLSTKELLDVEDACDTSMLSRHMGLELEKYVALHPDQIPALKLLALTLKRNGQVVRSDAVRQRIYRLDPSDESALLTLAALRWRMNEPAKALDLLVRHHASESRPEPEYWRLVSALAWSLERDAEAKTALEALWAAGELDETSAERLLVLAEEQGDHDRIIHVGNEAWELFGHPHWLLTAMEAAVVGKRWHRLGQFVEASRRSSPEFAKTARWWMLVVQLADHEGDADAALQAVRHALLLDPADKLVREAFLWRALAGNDVSLVKEAVVAWEPDAAQTPDIWRPLASALHRLGRSAEAVRWLRHAAAIRVRDLAWQFEVASEMEYLGRRDLARPLWARVETLLGDSKATALVRDRAALGVALRLRGSAEVEQAATRLLDNHPANKDALVDAIYAWLELEKPAFARDVLDGSPTPLPESVHVHVALAAKDRERLLALLESGAAFSPVERVGALRILGRLTQAWSVARASLPNASEPDKTHLAEHAYELREALGSRAKLSLGGERHLGVSLSALQAEASTGFEAGRLLVAASVTRLKSSAEFYETNACVAVERNRERYFTRAAVGVDVRADSVLPQAEAVYRRRWQDRLELAGELRVNSLRELTPALRAVGSESRVGGSAQLALTKDTLLMAEAWARRLALRTDGALAQGVAAHVAVERTWRFPVVDLSFSATGSAERNRFTKDPFNPNAPPEQRGEIYAAGSAFLLGGGVSAESPWSLPRPFVPRWRAAFWTGWLIPERRHVFSSTVEAALPVSDDITLVLDGFISNDEPWLRSASTSVGARLTGQVEF